MYLIGIAGGSGSGKSTFAEKIVEIVNHNQVAHVNLDWYYLPRQNPDHFIKGKPNFDHPEAFDWELLERQLKSLKENNPVEAPVYNFKTSSRESETKQIGPCSIIILEGIYSLYNPRIRELLDLKVFLDVDADIRFIRRLHRDVRERGRTLDGVINQYYDTVRPMHRQFLQPTSQFADLLVGEETDIAANVIAEKIKAVLGL